MCVCVRTSICDAHGDQEKASDPLELDLQAIGCPPQALRIELISSAKAASPLKYSAIFPALEAVNFVKPRLINIIADNLSLIMAGHNPCSPHFLVLHHLGALGGFLPLAGFPEALLLHRSPAKVLIQFSQTDALQLSLVRTQS